MIEINNLSKSYGKKAALMDVSLTVPQGEILGLFGGTERERPPSSSACWATSSTRGR